ncbi:MAG: ABC transporter ATP-binding protein [Nitrospira sp.]|nr:ABC transporter ATP-binding protein [Nitrospira sp.]
MAESSVELRDVSKRHGDTLAVDRVSLVIRRGEFFAILGPSGSGKTTILRMLAGFESPDAGDILIDGRSVRGVPPNRRSVNLVFQTYALFPHLTVAGNIAFGLEMRRVPAAEIAARVAEALDMVRLQGKQDRLPAQLSGGEQQRVALARALVNRPAVLLLDEPLGALDQQLRMDMQVELKTIQERVGLTFICVTHHQEEALTMSDRVAVMRQGRLLQVGSPRDIYEAPQSAFVANFIGRSNSLTGRIETVNGLRCTLRAADLPAAALVAATCPAGAGIGSPATLMLRPERLHLSADVQVDGYDNMLPARVCKAIYNGSETQYLLALSDRLSWQVLVPNVGNGQKRFQPGESVFLRWRADDAVVMPE